MAGLSYILDTNILADCINERLDVQERLYVARQKTEWIYICQPVHFEIMRGLLRINATRKKAVLEQKLMPLLVWLRLTDSDWQQAARFWADVTSRGRQLSDVDLLIAALADRLDAIIVSSDSDFDVLPIKRENWRTG